MLRVCSTQERAEQIFAEKVKSLENEYEDWIEREDFVLDKGYGYWDLYEDGYSSSNHVTLNMDECELFD